MQSIKRQLCEAAAERLVRLLESDYLKMIDAIALDDQELLRLSKLTLNQQLYLIHHADELLNITIETRGLPIRWEPESWNNLSASKEKNAPPRFTLANIAYLQPVELLLQDRNHQAYQPLFCEGHKSEFS